MKNILLIATGGTIASKDNGNGLTPSIDVNPFEGLKPYKLENDDGRLIDEPVSVPKPAVAKFDVMATAVPPEEPAAVLSVSYAL